jgi:hypothetical protein
MYVLKGGDRDGLDRFSNKKLNELNKFNKKLVIYLSYYTAFMPTYRDIWFFLIVRKGQSSEYKKRLS